MNKRCMRAMAGGVCLIVPAAAMADFKIIDGKNELSISVRLNAHVEGVQASKATVPGGEPESRSRVNQNASELGFSATRTLDNGMQAFAAVRSEVQSFSGGNGNNTATFAFRNTGAGLRSGFGEVALGRWDVHYQHYAMQVEHAYLTGPLAWATGSVIAFMGTSELIGNRFGNTIRYNTPTLGGFTGHAAATRNDGGLNSAAASGITNAQDRGYNLALTYRNGGLAAFASGFHRSEFIMNMPFSTVASLASQKSLRAGMRYTLPIGLSIGLGVDRSSEGHEVPAGAGAFAGERKASRTAWAVPLEYRTGQHAFHAAYGEARDATGNLFSNSAIGTNANTGAKFASLGYRYWIEPGMNVHVGWAKLTNDSNGTYDLYLGAGTGTGIRGNPSPAARGTDVQSVQVGLYYSF